MDTQTKWILLSSGHYNWKVIKQAWSFPYHIPFLRGCNIGLGNKRQKDNDNQPLSGITSATTTTTRNGLNGIWVKAAGESPILPTFPSLSLPDSGELFLIPQWNLLLLAPPTHLNFFRDQGKRKRICLDEVNGGWRWEVIPYHHFPGRSQEGALIHQFHPLVKLVSNPHFPPCESPWHGRV